MSKIKRIAIVVMICMLAVLGMNNISNAYSIGQEIYVTREQYWNSSNILCMQKWQHMDGATYKVVSHVNIEGTKAKDHTGKEVEHWDNAKFAYILSSTADKHSVVKQAVWNFGYTWMQDVGKQFTGLKSGYFASSDGGYSTTLDTESTAYANNLKDGTKKVTDKTNKDNIKVETYKKDGTQYMRVGPFNWSFGGTLSEVSVYNQNSNKISGVLYSNFSGTTERWFNVSNIKSGSDFYISVPVNSGVTKITKISGNIQLDVKGVSVWFLDSVNGYDQNLIIREPYNATEDIDLSFDYNIPMLGNLKVIKVNKDNTTVKLANVGFYIQNKNTGKYVKKASDGTISYVDNKNQATEFVTDSNGQITIKNLIVGTYVAYETKNPNYGYEIISKGQEKDVVVDKTAELQIPNKQKYIKLSGYVWLDKIDGKQSGKNDLYKDNDYDSNDMLLDGITVRLKDKSGNVIKETKTSNGGAYKFIDVLVDDLDKYYVEFEYDGLTYTNVVAHIDKNNGSKASENTTTRLNFNKDFSIVEGKTENTGITRDSSGNEKHTLTYSIDNEKHEAILNNTGLYPITANTNETGYSIKAHFKVGQEEIKYINLGLYEREQPDIAVVKDLQNVKVAVNGYNHVYNYAHRFENQGEYGDGFNVGVKFGSKYGTMSYSRAVYKADYEYTNEQDKSKELKVYVTYKIALKNQSTNLIVQVNNIVDYYDSKYSITKVGTDLDEQGNVLGDITHSDTNYNADYSKSIINTNTKIDAQKESYIYVQFELNREAVLNILNNGDNLNNVVEINSYSVFDTNGSVYAGVDKDSNPGNVVPGKPTTYEDDTDSAPGLQLEVAKNNREMTGKVFLDSTSNELMTGEVRQGSGTYEDGEKGIAGVEVTLTETSGSGKGYTAITNENGDFLISGYIPGDYTLTYTWGDETYTVQNYKGTIYDSLRDQNNKNWYKENVDTRLTDAMDDYELRQDIDGEITNITGIPTTTIDKMNSTTPVMGIGVEEATDGNTKYGITQIETASDGDEFVTADFKIKNIDFGIVERARQDLALEKRIAAFKVTLANGQVIADVTDIDENGKMTGETNHVVYMGPSATTEPNNGFIKLELDNELIQGATVEVGYEIKSTNNSELDYLSEEFYKYGKQVGNLITITPSAIIDYLDKDWAFESEKNTEWQVKTVEDIKGIVSAEVYGDDSEIFDRTILYTESLSKEELKPTDSASVMLNVSKILSNSDEIELDNETEITKLSKTGGSMTDSIPGNYVPGTGSTESDDSMAETVIVTPSTGENLNFIVPTVVGVLALVILATGVVIIKKKTL